MSARAEKLVKILKELEKNSAIEGSALVSAKGQMMAHALHSDIDPQSVAAMSAALTSVGGRVGQTLNAGELNQMVLTGFSKIVVVNILQNSVLITLAPSDAAIGLLEFEIAQAIDKIKLTLG